MRAGRANWVGYHNADQPHSGLDGGAPDEAHQATEQTPLPGTSSKGEQQIGGMNATRE